MSTFKTTKPMKFYPPHPTVTERGIPAEVMDEYWRRYWNPITVPAGTGVERVGITTLYTEMGYKYRSGGLVTITYTDPEGRLWETYQDAESDLVPA